ncbi:MULTISPECIES: electron transfer flavoprotein subunit alpha/FixB family protein [Haloferax]|uniref:Electron transfer flavoprotein subunit alpha/FixB family protein n=1 Tax=Haloferax marinum TaxID=2666143 RepID=A0A6A8G8I7_9EURY|nr:MULTISPECIES: electron transfer flavoprotein subunit alpha/FixB family protein [Haloferax]KAB1197823.1 electron transfer flavoprotein subunit alpha/FixB family protein [Haloferax sp. CBA1150]MRW96882.1 electron transfer flavoprotein subunit alpha/FixB family protein [Haloferax marinum]
MSDVLVVAEHRQDSLRDVSFELVTAGRNLADEMDGTLDVAVISGAVESFAEALSLDGVDRIHTVDYGDEFNHDVYTQAVTQLHDAVDPTVLLLPNSVNGLDYAPAVATRLGLPYVSDTVDVEWDGEGVVTVREQFGGKVETVVGVDDDAAVVSVRPGAYAPADTDGTASVVAFDAEIETDAVLTDVRGFEEVAGGDVDITEADVLVSVGRGIEDEENLDLIFDLAEALDATVSASRPVVDDGWLDKGRQVGQSGKVVTPDVYLAIGISGAVQHVAGMKGAETIVAVNTDPNAPIFDIADYGVVDDLFDVVPELIEQLG